MLRKPIAGLVDLFGWVLLLVIAIPTGQAFAIQESEPIEKPELVAIASLLPDDAPDLSELECFAPNGEPIDAETMKRFQARLEPKHFQYEDHVTERVEHLNPIFMVFNVDTRLTDSGVVPYLEFDGLEVPARSYHTGANAGYLTAIITGSDKVKEWPESCELTIRYADKNPEVVKEFTGPVAGKTELVDVLYCEMTDRMGLPSLLIARPFPSKAKPTEYYSTVVRLQDDTILKPAYVQTQSDMVNGQERRMIAEITEPVVAGDIKKITVTKSTFVFEEYGSVRLKAKSK